MSHQSRWPASQPIAVALCCAGLVGTLISSGILADDWYARRAWLRSEAHERIERQVDDATRDWDDPTSGGQRPGDDGRPAAEAAAVDTAAVDTGRLLAPAVQSGRSASASPQRRPVAPSSLGATAVVPRASSVPAIRAPEVVGASLRLFDPPQPGAHASLGVTLRSRPDAPSPPVIVGIPADWFEQYEVLGAVPPVLDDQAGDDGYRYFSFPGADRGVNVTRELHVLALGEDVRIPTVRLTVGDGGSLGVLRPDVVAPGVPLGPVRALSVPRLGIRTGVIDTAWEPPPFVAGQISVTAGLGGGNSVLVGHRGGRAGDVFARLAGAMLGDAVVAASHGVEQRYTVSEIRILPASDSTPIGPTETPRLTLMTCIGAWNPLTGEYSHRLWVVAEPPDLARATLAATVERASQTAATSADPAEASRARADAAVARAALSAMQAAAPRSRP